MTVHYATIWDASEEEAVKGEMDFPVDEGSIEAPSPKRAAEILAGGPVVSVRFPQRHRSYLLLHERGKVFRRGNTLYEIASDSSSSYLPYTNYSDEGWRIRKVLEGMGVSREEIKRDFEGVLKDE